MLTDLKNSTSNKKYFDKFDTFAVHFPNCSVHKKTLQYIVNKCGQHTKFPLQKFENKLQNFVSILRNLIFSLYLTNECTVRLVDQVMLSYHSYKVEKLHVFFNTCFATCILVMPPKAINYSCNLQHNVANTELHNVTKYPQKKVEV